MNASAIVISRVRIDGGFSPTGAFGSLGCSPVPFGGGMSDSELQTPVFDTAVARVVGLEQRRGPIPGARSTKLEASPPHPLLGWALRDSQSAERRTHTPFALFRRNDRS